MKTTHIYPSVTLFGLDFFQGELHSFIEFIDQQMSFGQLVTISTPNPEQIVLAKNNPTFLKTIKQFDVYIPDGAGIVWGAEILKAGRLERITGVDVVSELLKQHNSSRKVLIIGGRDYDRLTPSLPFDETQGVFALTNISPSSQVFWMHGHHDVRNTQQNMKADAVIQQVVATLKPDIIFVAFGAPYQEQWVIKHKDFLLKHSVKMVMVVGGAFDMLLGKIPRAPKVIQRVGLEWLYRLVRQPWRWRRQFALVRFVGIVGKRVLSN